MNKIKLSAIALMLMTVLFACGSGSSQQPATADGFSEIEKDIKSEFGDDAYFTDLTITYSESIGNIIGLSVTKDPSSLKMGQWNQAQGRWTQTSDITLEVPPGTEAADFMFQLDDQISLKKLGESIEKAKEVLKTEKQLDNPTLSVASIYFPKNGDISKTEYMINLTPEHGGTHFRFSYSLSGELIDMDY